MSDLIKREDVLETISKDQWYFIKPREQIERIKAIPTAEPKVGRWILEYLVSTDGNPYAVYRCNLCEWAEPTLLRRNYCPNCGSRMFERRADGDI